MNTIKITIHHPNDTVTNLTQDLGNRSFEQIQAFHDQMSQDNPDCHVNMSWTPEGASQASFICGMRYDQKQDELALATGNMTQEQYEAKWYTWNQTQD